MRHVLPAAVLFASGVVVAAPQALADQTVQPTRSVWGCVDPRATTALAIPDGRLRNHKWVDYVHRSGQCSLLPAGKPLAVLAHQGGLLLLKAPGAPESSLPVYAQGADMSAVAAPAAADSGATQTSAPSTADASTPTAAPAEATPAPATTMQDAPATPDQGVAAATPSAAAPSSATPASPTAPVVAPGTSAAGPAPSAPVSSAPISPMPNSVGTDAAAPGSVPPASPVIVPTPAPAAVAPSVASEPAPEPAPVVAAPAARRGSSGMVWLAVIVVLALLALVGAAVLVSRQQRRFAHVEDTDWPPRDDHADPLTSPSPVIPAVQPEPTPQNFRRACVEVLEQGGWTIQPTFAAGAAREGAPDILGRRRDAVLAVRGRGGSATVTPEIIDEVAAMGQATRAHVTVLATPAPLTRRAHDEAMRLHVHVLDQDELGSLSA